MLNWRSHVFGVGVREAEELVLVQVHDDKLVRRRQVHRHLGELLVEVTGVPAVSLQVLQVVDETMEGSGDTIMITIIIRKIKLLEGDWNEMYGKKRG